MKKTSSSSLILSLFFLQLAVVEKARADISEYFLRDPYDQLDLFRQIDPLKKDKLPKEEEEKEDLYDEYYDYLYDVGALPKKESTTPEPTTTSTTPMPSIKRLLPRKGPLTVADDVLELVKKPRTSPKQRYNFVKRVDNIAAESNGKPIRRMGRPSFKKPHPQKKHPNKPVMQRKAAESKDLPGLENVERLIPSSLKTVIEDSGRRIVKAVMQPINSVPRNTVIRESSFTTQMESWLQPYRTYMGYMAPTFAPAHITTFLVTQWVSTIAITVAWITVGYMYQTMIGRSAEARSSPEPWESLVPDSGTMATVLRDLSDAAQRWHDEL